MASTLPADVFRQAAGAQTTLEPQTALKPSLVHAPANEIAPNHGRPLLQRRLCPKKRGAVSRRAFPLRHKQHSVL